MRNISKISVVIVIIFLILAIAAYDGDFNQFQFGNFSYQAIIPNATYVGHMTSEGYTYSGPILFEKAIVLPYADSYVLTMTTSALSAENPINVNAEIKFKPNTIDNSFKEKYESSKEHIVIAFPHAYSYAPLDLSGQHNAFVWLQPTNDPTIFRGSGAKSIHLKVIMVTFFSQLKT